MANLYYDKSGTKVPFQDERTNFWLGNGRGGNTYFLFDYSLPLRDTGGLAAPLIRGPYKEVRAYFRKYLADSKAK